MKAGEVILQDLLNGKLQYRVPIFQRTYSWDEEQWERLWDDILELYAMSSPRKHFIGSIVTQPIPDAPEHAAKFMLIDGQQRMTTLLLLLAVIRFHASRSPEDTTLAGEIADTCLRNVHISDTAEQFKLRPTLRDQEAFRQAMEGEIPVEAGRIGKAWDYFSKMVESGDHENNPIRLRQLKERTTYYLDLVSIKLETGDSPNRIFESLNNTGVRLKAADLVRNYVFMRISDEGQQNRAYEQIWFPMQEALGDSMDDFFWRYSMKDGSLTRWDDIFDDTKAALDKLPNEETIPSLKDFSKFSEYYLRIKEPRQREASQVIADQLDRLNDWEVDVSYPFLLTLFDMQANTQVQTEEIVNVLKMIESFVVRRTICGVPTNRLRRIFAGMVVQCRAIDVVWSCREYLQNNDWPLDDEFYEKLVNYRVYNPARLARTRLILRSIESSFGHKESPAVTDDITIEHIMPQHLTDEWMEMLGNDPRLVHSRWL